jgi:hypothetical protein
MERFKKSEYRGVLDGRIKIVTSGTHTRKTTTFMKDLRKNTTQGYKMKF